MCVGGEEVEEGVEVGGGHTVAWCALVCADSPLKEADRWLCWWEG